MRAKVYPENLAFGSSPDAKGELPEGTRRRQGGLRRVRRRERLFTGDRRSGLADPSPKHSRLPPLWWWLFSPVQGDKTKGLGHASECSTTQLSHLCFLPSDS